MKLKLMLLGFVSSLILGFSKQYYLSARNLKIKNDDSPNIDQLQTTQQELYIATPEHVFIIRQANLMEAYIQESYGCGNNKASSLETKELARPIHRIRCSQV